VKKEGRLDLMAGTLPKSGSNPEEPSFANAFALQARGNFHRAAAEYSRFLKVHPDATSALNNLGNCLRSLGRDTDAVRCFERALSLQPDRDSTRLNMALARLALGQYREAWPDYETRFQVIPYRRELMAHRNRQWNGERLGSDRILYLFGNQGLGDELQCLRYVPLVADRVEKVVMELQAAMIPLAGDLPANVEIIKRGESIPSFHKWVELFSLPGIFGTELTSIPAPIRPRFTSNSRIEAILAKSRMHHPGDLHVGLVWSGNPKNDLNRFRACGLDHLKPLLDLPGVQFFSLQKGPATCELKSDSPINDLAPHLDDFAATATAMDSLDVVITPDTSVAHLAGVLGLQSWIILHSPADWRWGREGSSSPWYPTLKLYRQERMRDWAPVISKVSNDLQKLTRNGLMSPNY